MTNPPTSKPPYCFNVSDTTAIPFEVACALASIASASPAIKNMSNWDVNLGGT